jgi:putative ABC transport system permease protein
MITSVLERMKEIGVIKSIGARNSEVLNLFLFESAFLGFIAGAIGVLLGFGLAVIMGKILQILGWGFLQPGYSVWLFAGCILFATVTGAVSGIIPAIHGSRISPVNALRYE